jgi:hypothetical protein
MTASPTMSTVASSHGAPSSPWSCLYINTVTVAYRPHSQNVPAGVVHISWAETGCWPLISGGSAGGDEVRVRQKRQLLFDQGGLDRPSATNRARGPVPMTHPTGRTL